MSLRPLVLLCATVAAGAWWPASALATPADVAAAQLYIGANYALLQSASAHLASSEAGPLEVLARVRRECPSAAAGSPQDGESTKLSNEVIGAMVLAAYRFELPAIRSFIRTVSRLHFSDHGLASAVRSYAAKLTTLSTLPSPSLCGDIAAWAASRFQTLPASTVRFDQGFEPAWVALGALPTSLRAFERPQERGTLARSGQIEVQLTDAEARAVERYADIMNELALSP